MPQTTTLPAIRYTQTGTAGPRVLLLMGYGMRGEVWKPQVDGLSSHCQVVHFDNRGIGDSELVDAPLSILDMAKDAARVLDALDWREDVHLVGVSMGGMIAQELALHEPGRFATLTLMATHAGGFGAIVPRLTGIAHFLAVRMGPPHKRNQALARLLYPKAFLDSCDRKALHSRMDMQMQREPPRATIRRQLMAILRHNTRARLGKIQIPTLIIKPEKDILVHPRHSDHLARAIAHASVLRLPDAGHGLIFQSAAQINRELLRHVGALESEATPA